MGMENTAPQASGQDVSSVGTKVGTTNSSSMNQAKMASANTSSNTGSSDSSSNKLNWRDIASMVQSMNSNSGQQAPVTFNAMSQPQPVANF